MTSAQRAMRQEVRSALPRRRLRIWHLAENYPPHYGGGAAIYLRDVCRFIAERGHEVRVLCCEATDAEPYGVRSEFDGTVRVDRLNLPYRRAQGPGGWQLGIRGWRAHSRRTRGVADALLREWRPDLVHFHTPYSVYEECLPVIRRHGLPVVGLAHDAWLICLRMNLIRSPMESACDGPGVLRCLECVYSHWDGTHARAILKLPWRLLKLGPYPAYRLLSRYRARREVDGLVAYSEFIRRVHARRVPGPVVHVPLGVDLVGLPAERVQRPRSPLRFGFAGGFQPHKGISEVLGAAADLRRRGLAFELHIWGPSQDDAQGQIESRGLGGCAFWRGTFAPDERWAVFSEFDVLVMATQVAEAFGRVVQEAAALGVPSIAPAVGGISEQIRDGVDGLLYRFRDQSDLERQMARVIERPALVTELAANLWPVVDTRAAVEAVEDFYFKVLAAKAGPAWTPS